MLTDIQKNVLTRLVNTLQKNDIGFQLTGGIAAICFGANNRPLYDIDIDIYAKDAGKVQNLFANYIVEDWNNELEGPDDQFDLWMMTLVIDGVPIDISQVEEASVRGEGGSWVKQPGTMSPETRSFAGLMVPVQNKEELVAYKKILRRSTDLDDIAQIH